LKNAILTQYHKCAATTPCSVDALALEAVKEWSHAHQSSIALVSRAVPGVCSDDGPLYSYESLAEYLDAIASEDAILSDFIREAVIRHDGHINESAMEAFAELDFHLSDEDGDIGTVDVTDIDYDGGVEIISLESTRSVVEMAVTFTFNATVTYDQDRGSYLEPERVRIRTRRTASRKIGIEVAFAALDPESFEINDVWIEGKQDVPIRLNDDDW
jgi:hypothetical protein